MEHVAAPVNNVPDSAEQAIRDAVVRARALRNSDPATGIDIANRAQTAARALYTQHPDSPVAQRLLADALAALGHCQRMSSSLLDAVRNSSEAASLYELLADQLPESMARSQWGIALVQLGDLVGGLRQLERSRELCVAAGSKQGESDALLDIGVVHNMLGDDARAIALYEQALPSYEAANDVYHVASCLHNMGYAHDCWGERERAAGRIRDANTHFESAISLVLQALPLARRCDHIDFVATCLNTLSLARRHSGDLDGCMAALREQLDIADQIVGYRMRAVCRATIADALLQRAAPGDLDEALRLLHEADTLCTEHQLRESHPSVIESLALALERSGDAAAALAAYRRFHALQMQVHSEAAEREARSLESRLRLERTESDLEMARQRERELDALNAQLRDKQTELERLAHVDALTGLANRRSWLQQLAAEWARDRGDLYLLLLDIDRFKAINDAYGHAAGDAVLQRIGACLSRALSHIGGAGRFGGEEFVAWCRVESPQAMERLAETVLDGIRAVPWNNVATGLSVTASLGWTAAAGQPSEDAALSNADRRMYDAKRAGRDRVAG